MLNSYETIFITIPDIPDDSLKTIRSKVEKAISKEKGEIIKKDDWGVRRLAYEIKRNKKGKYLYYYYNSGPGAVTDIERNLRLDERVIRFMTFRIEPEKDESKSKKAKKVKK